MNEKSLVILKPDAIQRGLVGVILSRFENTGLKIEAMKLQSITREQAKKHYAEHIEKGFYQNIEDYIVSGPSLVLILSGMQAVSKIRLMVGATEPASATPGTIRGDFAHQSYPAKGEEDDKPIRNLVHASASLKEANHEINIWFSKNECVEYKRVIDEQVSLI